MSMANSLEVRVPLLDHVLAEYVARIPAAQRFPRWQLKALLKEAMKGTLPREVLEQRKHGFTIPLARWFRGDLVGFAGEILTGPETRARGLLDVDAVTTFLRQHSEGRRNLGPAIWSLLIFELWCREILD
jgi:asparagine synthase (glutamine-hydrolysing)